MRILVTGFEPLKQYWSINPSWEAVRLLPDKIGTAQIIKKEIPIAYKKVNVLLPQLLDEYKPDVVISVGQSGHDSSIMLERIAVNVDDFNVPDNDGELLIDKKVAEDGPDAYLSNLPIRRMVEKVREGGIPSDISESAGTHLCNHVMYTVRHICTQKYPNTISGFIHVPLHISQCVSGRRKSIGNYYMDVNAAAKGLQLAIEEIIRYIAEQHN